MMLFNWGTESVLVFFLLSGTVIRLSMDANPKSRLQFLKRRATRIIPLYVVAIFLTIAVSFFAGKTLSLWVVVGNLLFLQTLQGYITPTIWSNAALWSLSFEVFFYLVFASTIGNYQKKLLYLWVITSFIAVITQYFVSLPGIFGHLTIMLAYSSIWLLGYYLVDISKYIKFDLVFVFASLGLLPIIARVHISNEYYIALKHFIVACSIAPLFIFILTPSHAEASTESEKPTKLKWYVWGFVYTALLIFNFKSQSLLFSKIVYSFFPILTTTSMFLYRKYFQKPFRFNERFCLLIGQFSYALYIIHTPLIHAVNLAPLNIFTKAIMSIAVSCVFTYIAEFYLHPLLTRKTLANS